ncbi:hypothetical protein [Crenobacter caeni]|uniref:Uncharacterized protein n=1 Tax=Crenobacter caeni TaxID=2705474 RepID=A0A6B2KNX5_9NEIS|nr:hypothetical protein [Crenobacter caeni]NDV11781.1 hypothetical protein [Crenobacter caeni]
MTFKNECDFSAGEAIRSNRTSELSPAVRELADLLAELACRQLKRQALIPEGSEQEGDRE